MKLSQHNTPQERVKSLSDVIHWRESLLQWHQRLAPHFARPEPFHRVLRFVQGILSETPRKNGWQLAEQAREATPYGMQRLLSQAVWNEDGVRNEIRAFVLRSLGLDHLIGVVDESHFPKRGKHSAGVARQYCGLTGDVRNGQVGVFLSLVGAPGHTLIDRELYLPREWTDDPARCRQAHIPPTRTFLTKPQLARLMLERLRQAGVRLEWVTADSVYGENAQLRAWLETQGQPYVMAVSCTEPVVVDLPPHGVRRLEVRDVPALLVPSDWVRLSSGQGTKGPRLFDWVLMPIWHQGREDGWHALLIRQPLIPGAEPTFYLVYASPPIMLQETVSAQGARWHIEEDLENGKDLGLDHAEVRSYGGWYRHVTLVLLALAFLTSLRCAARAPVTAPVQAAVESCLVPPACWPPSVPEARRLLARLLFPPSSSPPLVFQWSQWRRWHQRLACFFHTRRRVKAG